LNELDRSYCKQIFEASKNKDLEAALIAYHKLKTGRADVRVYTALIKACNQPTRLTEAVDIYNDMLAAEIRPNLATFQTLLDSCVIDNHLERAFYFFKEYLQTPGSKSEGKPRRKYYLTLLKLCFTNKAPHKAVFIYQNYMNDFQPKVIPLEFVSTFLSSFEARDFHYEMNRVMNPNFKREISTVELLFGDFTREKEIGHSKYLEDDFSLNQLHKFPLKVEDPKLGMFYDSLWRTFYDEMSIEKGDEYPFPDDKEDMKESRYKKMIGLFDNYGNDEGIAKVLGDFRRERKQKINHAPSKAKWRPVIFTDNGDFIPTKVSINNVSEKSIKAAKLEYTSTIQDIDVREEVEYELNQRVRIHWIDEKGNLIEGVTH